MENDNRLTSQKEWRKGFDSRLLEEGRALANSGKVKFFWSDGSSAHARVESGLREEKVNISGAPLNYSMNWNPSKYSCTCRSRYKYRYYGLSDTPCRHLAAVFFIWEEKHGPWIFTETEEEYALRLKGEEAERERARFLLLKKQEEQVIVNIGNFLEERGRRPKGTFFDIKAAIGRRNTNLYAVHLADRLLKTEGSVRVSSIETTYGPNNEQQLEVRASVKDLESSYEKWNSVRMTFSPRALVDDMCGCQYSPSLNLYTLSFCGHKLAVLVKVFDYVNENDPGDATDVTANLFLDAMGQAGQNLGATEEGSQIQKKADVEITPVLNVENGSVTLSFKIGILGQRKLQLKDLEGLAEAVRAEGVFSASKMVDLDFSTQEVDEKSRPWLNFILQKVSDAGKVNEQLGLRNRWFYYAPSIMVQNKDELYGSTLDRFYDIAEGTDCECVKKRYDSRTGERDKETSRIHIGHHNIRVDIETNPLCGANGDFIGISVSGSMPIILFGSSDGYIIGDDYVSRISKEERKALYPFMKVSDKDGNIRFNIGKDKLAEFYYRIVPSIMELPYINFTDNCQGQAEGIMPPEPEFSFVLDCEGEYFTCSHKVSYNGEETLLPRSETNIKGIDGIQEKRTADAIREYFPDYVPEKGCYSVKASDDLLFDILTEGVVKLSRYGEVLGSDAFKRNRIRRTPQVSVGVSVESGIMDISVISKDVDSGELLDILESYKRKKRYYRLKSGEYVDLSRNEQLDGLEDMAERMDLSMEDLIREGVKVPAYRALYLNKLLEEREAIVSERDKTYRNLIKNFQTIKDADYEAPEGFKEVLRAYQVYGYKWLRTLFAAGFGGILADEMGLGKTLQAIALMESLKDEGESAPNLVVCPASLVYNWQEEIRRFSPKLSSCVLSGTASARKCELERLEGKGEGPLADIYITSYDSLRKDITLYEKIRFNVVILDEAQYIKNQKAGMTKAVKVLKGAHRLAMTGTPIENRLAELWSIFDFIMPGFLYGYNDFSQKYEVPIAKSRDMNAAENLKNMVRPFILRRLKAEVLKELPDKLEETRYVRFDDTQRRLYDGQVVRLKNLIGSSKGNYEDKMRILAELTKLREICCDPSLIFENYHGDSAKRKGCIELINSAISGGHKILVFSQFRSMLELLEGDLKENGIDYYMITGLTPKELRVRMVHEFNDGDVPVFLISLKAGGTGLNLTGADVVIHYDPWWNLAAQNQATDRAHRIGQENTVTVYKMIAKDTVEEKILGLQEAKRDLADAILEGEGKSLFTLSGEELLGLLN